MDVLAVASGAGSAALVLAAEGGGEGAGLQINFFWIIVSSLKTNLETHTVPVTFIPVDWTTYAYEEIFRRRNFARYMTNAMVISLATTAWGVLVAAWSGYGFARYDFRFKAAIMAFVLIAQSFPRILLVIPYFQLANRFDLQDTHIALILAYSTFIQPLCLWIMKEYFEQIPRELDEAALVDEDTRARLESLPASLRVRGDTVPLDYEVENGAAIRMPIKAGPHTIGAAFIRKNHAPVEDVIQPFEFSLFEPAVIIFMGVVVGFVAVAMVSAMYGIFNQSTSV